jgi:peptidoglycan/xylan/chitin deacetylase (PgdA/CDA1 family)
MSVRTTAGEILVLAYHRIGEPPPGPWNDWFYVSEEAFTDHLRILHESGWAFIDLPRLLVGMEDPASVPPRAVLITFDDADGTMLTGGLPHLARLRIPAVLFVPTGFIGGTTDDFDNGAQPPERICGWDELRRLQTCGVSIQAHGVSHRRFAELPASTIRRELRCCKDVLEGCLRHPVEAFAYPFGDIGRDPPATEKMLMELGYRAAFLYDRSYPWPLVGSRRFQLGRLAVGRDTDLRRELARLRYDRSPPGSGKETTA